MRVNIIRLIINNLLVFLIGIIIIELTFGNWFKNNFGIKLSSNKNIFRKYKYNFPDHKGISTYIRDNNGFRIEKSNEPVKPEEIKILFTGGSTLNQKFTNYNETIVGSIENREPKLKKKIANAGIDGLTIDGHINSFNFWFNKIQSLNPKYIIFLIGTNDFMYFSEDEKKNLDVSDIANSFGEKNFLNNLKYYIKSNSWFIQKGKLLIMNFFPNKGIRNVSLAIYGPKDKNKKFINYNNFITTHDIKNIKNNKFEEAYKNKVIKLIKLSINKNFKPIFFIQSPGYGMNKKIYLISKVILEQCANFNIKCFDLNKEVNFVSADFYDWAHTTLSGSKKISNFIYKKLIIQKNINLN